MRQNRTPSAISISEVLQFYLSAAQATASRYQQFAPTTVAYDDDDAGKTSARTTITSGQWEELLQARH